MNNVWKSLVVLSLAMNVILAVRVARLGGGPAAPAPTADGGGAPMDPTQRPTEPAVVLPPPPPAAKFTEDTSALARQVRGELFPQLETMLSKSFPGMGPDKLDLSEGRFVLMMKSTNESRTTRESVRGMLEGAMRSYAEGRPELKDRTPQARFPEDPPPRGHGI